MSGSSDARDVGARDTGRTDAADLRVDGTDIGEPAEAGDPTLDGPNEDVAAPDAVADPPAVDAAADVADISPELGSDVAVDGCPAPPSDAPAEAVEAWQTANGYRLAMGIPCATLIAELNTAAQNHCNYWSANSGACTANPHVEVEGCTGFTGANFWERMAAAGYTGGAAFEDMHFIGDGAGAVHGWVDTVWHRTPILSPWITHLGYGQTAGCDTMDFGYGEPADANAVATYPHPGQTGVPAAFYGNEGPPPPAPPGGWPSGYIVHIYAQGAAITEHVITLDGSDTPLDHIWLGPGDSVLLTREHVLYTHQPLTSGATYRVRITGTYVGGPLALDWTFTVQ